MNIFIKKNLIEKNRYDIFPEVIIYSKELALAGTIDLLLYDRKTKSYKLLDWKTSRKIETRSFNSKTVSPSNCIFSLLNSRNKIK